MSATPEASSWRQRLQLLLESHIDELKAKKLQPPLNSVVIEQGSRATRILIVSQGRLAVEQQLVLVQVWVLLQIISKMSLEFLKPTRLESEVVLFQPNFLMKMAKPWVE